MIIPKGGTGLGSISEDGNWIEKSDMMYVDDDGSPAELIPSSYDGEIELNKSVSIEFLLEHNITSIYSLQGEENHPDFVKAVADNKDIFTFVFNYRADYEADDAYLLTSAGEVFAVVGKKAELEYIGLENKEEEVPEEPEAEASEDDDFDFGML